MHIIILIIRIRRHNEALMIMSIRRNNSNNSNYNSTKKSQITSCNLNSKQFSRRARRNKTDQVFLLLLHQLQPQLPSHPIENKSNHLHYRISRITLDLLLDQRYILLFRLINHSTNPTVIHSFDINRINLLFSSIRTTIYR